jgi:hypothetical protein
MRNCFVALLALLAACQAAPPAPAGAALTGSWGGEHIGLELSAAGGRLEYDCAAGTIDEPVRPDARGRFNARGAHTPNTGGPERVDVPRPQVEATYSGQVNGDRLTLSVSTPEAELGPFSLQRGAQPMLMRCL